MKVIGTYAESAFHGLKVYEINEHDYTIRFQWFYNGNPDSRVTRANIQTTRVWGRPYFITRGRRVHLDNIMRE